MKSPRTLVILISVVLAVPIFAQLQERVDLEAVYKIKDEGFQRSQIMEVASYLTDVHGPRLTGSPNLRAAGEYARDKLLQWELTNVALESWGPFGRGWTNDRFTAQVVSTPPFPLIAYPKAWTPGTNGPVTADAVIAVIQDEGDFNRHRGQLQGKYVLTAPMRQVPARFEALGHRYTDEELQQRAAQPVPTRQGQRGGGGGGGGNAFNTRRLQFFLEEGVAALIEPGSGDGGTVFVQAGGSWATDAPAVPAQIVIAVEHYNRIYRMLEKNVPVRMEMDIRNTFHDDDLNSFNVIGEIRGTDKSDEVVMLGAHFDSWHTGTGATDNASGSAIMMEAMRILKATNLPMRRTVRMALWTGEEQGYFGSRAYVRAHFADRNTMQLQPAHSKVSAYFNVDNGTGAIRGVYLQGNEAAAPIFERWMEPFRNLGMTTLSIRSATGTDHIVYDEVGLPGFQFIQDPIEYDSRTHHSSMDVFDRLQEADMVKNAVIVASFVYHTANREELLPRKPLPRPRGQ